MANSKFTYTLSEDVGNTVKRWLLKLSCAARDMLAEQEETFRVFVKALSASLPDPDGEKLFIPDLVGIGSQERHEELEPFVKRGSNIYVRYFRAVQVAVSRNTNTFSANLVGALTFKSEP